MEAGTPPEGTPATPASDVLGTPAVGETAPPEGTTQTDTPSVPTTTNPPANVQPDVPQNPPDVQTPENVGATNVPPDVVVPETRDAAADKEPDKEQVQPGQPSAVAQDTGERDPYYCPGCGRGFLVPLECTGRPEAGHPPIQTVSTDELDGDTDKHTAAPATE